MNKYYIPIIGTISAGKSKFLQALLGINVLQSGACTTTKFICLIKNSKEIKFYHVIPKEDKILTFEKEGEEIQGEDNIKERIIDINKKLSETNKGTKNDIFYMLETPIKNIENIQLLDNCYFMDIPGLNENATSYIDIIFSLITIEKILFEIMVFDSTSIGSDNILNIFKELNKKGCLTLKNNIFVLNKIDLCTQNGLENIIDTFKQYFYETFEDEKKNNDKNSIIINIYENHFIPMNSILYLAETKMNEDFSSLLIFELFNYLEYNKDIPSFYEYLEKKIELIVNNNKDFDFDDEIKKVGDNEKEIIKRAIEEIKVISSNVQTNSEFQIGINLKKKKIQKEMEKLYSIHKNKKYNFFHSTFYLKIQEIMKNIHFDINNLNNLSPPPLKNCFENEINSLNKTDEQNNNLKNKIISNIDIETIEELEKFLNETFKLIDPTNQLKTFKYSLQSVRENILGRKLRVAFIGNISVGKSTVLNCIIGKDILPTKDSECTYRGIILRNNDSEDYKLYFTKLIPKGTGYDEYYYFETQQKPYCEGIENIKSHLKNKNNDKKISDNDAFLVITGKLKIFDFLELDEKIKNKIEFIDLPGHDRENNTFNKKEYFKKILKFSNCCIYVNEPKTIDDKESVERMSVQYLKDKEKVFPSLQNQFIKTCLFLINKSDTLNTEEERKNISNNLYKNISKVEKNLKKESDMNISFFSGKHFIYFLEVYYYYVEILEKNPIRLIDKLFNQYNGNIFNFKSIKSYLDNELSIIEEKFELDLDEENEDEDELQIPEQIKKKILKALNKRYKIGNPSLTRKDEDDFIEKLYIINQQLKNKDFSKTKYSSTFFRMIQDILLNSDKLQRQNFENSLIAFFSLADELFKKELHEEEEQSENKKYYNFINKELLPKVKDLFNHKEQTLKAFIGNGKSEALTLIKDEIDNISDRLKETNNDVGSASKKLQDKIKEIIENIKINQQRELESLNRELESLIEENFKEFKSNKSNFSEIETNAGISKKMIISLFTSTVTGVAVRMGLAFVGEAVLTSVAASSAIGGALSGIISATTAASLTGPVGIAIGFGVGFSISLGTLLVHYFSKETRYKKGLEDFQKNVEENFEESKRICLENFESYKQEFFKVIAQKMEVTQKKIDIDKKKWQEIQQNYNIKKEKIMNRIKSLNFEK